MIVIDNVYQKVLAIANKEQRGYITPQEFNLFADKAQMEIFENYFHDTKTAYHKRKNMMGVAFDEIELVQKKLDPFKAISSAVMAGNVNTINLPVNVYYMDTIMNKTNSSEIVELSEKDIAYTQNNPLTAATLNRRVFVREGNSIRIFPLSTVITSIDFHYWRRPRIPNWTYVVVNEQALYNASASDAENFELHESEEENLVTRILQLSGITIKQQDIQQAAIVEKQMSTQDKNN